MKLFVLGLLLFLNCACTKQVKKEDPGGAKIDLSLAEDSIKIDLIESLRELKIARDSLESYESVKTSIRVQKSTLAEEILGIDSLSVLFKVSLLNRIIPYWEGTEWSFEGHTAIPGKGEIACGYFVSTTLKDAGLNLNRYKLAQQSPVDEALSLAINSQVIEITGDSGEDMIKEINNSLPEGIHFIGFDASHVGYILKEKGQLYLIHSNYLGSTGVEIEQIENSAVFASYNRYYLTTLSTNENFLRSWISGKEVTVISQN